METYEFENCFGRGNLNKKGMRERPREITLILLSNIGRSNLRAVIVYKKQIKILFLLNEYLITMH